VIRTYYITKAKCFTIILTFIGFSLYSIPCKAITDKTDIAYDSTYINELRNIFNIGSKDSYGALTKLNSLLAKPEVNNYQLVLIKGYRMKSKYLKKLRQDSALYYINKSIQLAKKNDLKEEWFNSMKTYALTAKSMKQYSLSDSLYRVLFNDTYVEENKTKKVILYADYASLMVNQQKTQEAVDALSNAINIAAKYDYHDDDRFLYNRLGFLYFQLKDYKKSISYNHKTLEKLPANTSYKSSYLNSIAAGYLMLNELDSAKLYLDKTIDAGPSPSTRMYSYQYLSNIAVQEHEFESALRYANLCVALGVELNRRTCECELRQAISYNRLGENSRSQTILKKIKNCASQHITKSVSNTMRICEIDNTLRMMDRADLATMIDTIISERDSLNNSESKVQLLDIETQYETQKKETENILLKKDNAVAHIKLTQQRTLIGGSIITILSLGLLIINLVNRNKERKRHIEALNKKNEAIQALNQEISHRTKNHLALATALLSKDRRKSEDPQVKTILNENENRLRTLALVNKKLNNISKQDNINLKDYLQELCDDLIFSLKKDRNVSIQLLCPEIELNSEKALRLGLITNELITNSFKHAKTENNTLSLVLKIEVTSSNELNYSYNDNGINKVDVPKENHISQGISLIENLWSQLNGTFTQTMVPNYTMKATIVL
jgi:two-component sensor histidine kinase/archaellum component FlaF (FlaF/FlaG flagellin family)